MGGFCGAISNRDVVLDVYFGTDYHSHLGTRRGGMAAWDPELGFQREIHNIENAPFRTKFDKTVGEMVGKCCIGSISDTDPQPLLVRSVHGTYAICVVGVIQNEEAIIEQMLGDADRHFEAMSGGSRAHQPAAHHRRGHPLRPERGGGDRLCLNYDARFPHRRAGQDGPPAHPHRPGRRGLLRGL